MLVVENLKAEIGRVPVLKGVSLTVAPGQTIALLGRNGVGKTSTLRSIMGLLKRTGGTVSYKGQDLTKIAAHKLSNLGIGYVPQGRGIFPLLTVEENMLLGLDGDPPTEVLENLYTRFPRLFERRKQAAGTLSGGEQQMLAIARCLVKQPTIVMLDEPTEGIMPMLVNQIRDEIKAVARSGIAVLLVEQNLRTALKLADYVYLMERGEIVHEATPDALRENPEIVHRYLGVSL